MDRFIDSHNHLHGFSHDVWELQAISGMAATILSCGNPHVYREMWDHVPTAADVKELWESPLRFAEAAEEKHLISVRCALGISSMTRVDGWPELIDALPDYLADPRVVALGEVGLDPGQYFGFGWPLEEQAECLEAQARIAAALELPLILHTPTYKNPKEFLGGVDTQEGRRARGFPAPLPQAGSRDHRASRARPLAPGCRPRRRDDRRLRP